MRETGAVFAVITTQAGGLLVGDHLVGAEQLALTNGWDFDADGGQLSIDDEVYDYTFPAVAGSGGDDSETVYVPDDGEEPDDTEPTIVIITPPLADDCDDGAFIQALPTSEEKTAWVEAVGFDEAVPIRVEHALMPLLPDGIREDADAAETVTLEPDGDGWRITDIIGPPPAFDPGVIDTTGPSLPPELMPNEGWDYFGDVAMEQLVAGDLEVDQAVTGRIYVVDRETVGPDPEKDSGIVQITSDEGLQLFRPDGGVDSTGQPTYKAVVSLRTKPQVSEDKATYAIFRGRVEADDIAVLQGISIEGIAAKGFRSRVVPGAEFQMDAIIGNPVTSPEITYGPMTTKWPPMTSASEEFGLTTVPGAYAYHHDYDMDEVMMCGRFNPSSGRVQMRLVHVPTGDFIAETNVRANTYDNLVVQDVAGLTAVDSDRFAMLIKQGGKWRLSTFTLPAQFEVGYVQIKSIDVSTRNAWNEPYIRNRNDAALGNDGHYICLVSRDSDGTYGFQAYTAALHPREASSWDTSRIKVPDSNKALVGFSSERVPGPRAFVAMGNRIEVDRYIQYQPSESWWSRASTLTGFTRYGDQYVAINQSGTLIWYNNLIPDDSMTIRASYTKYDTASGRESKQSPVGTLSWPTQCFVTIQTAPLSGSGYDDVQVYAGTGNGSRETMWQIPGMAVGDTQVTIAQPPTTGAHPPAQSGFSSGTGQVVPGRWIAEEGGFHVNGQSNGSVGTGTFRDSIRNDVQNAVLPWASRTQPNAQSFTGGPTTAMLWPSGNSDPRGIITYATNGTFTVGEAGVYTIAFQCAVAKSQSSGRVGINIFRNGTDVQGTRGYASAAAVMMCTIPNAKLRLNAGDTLYLGLWTNLSGEVPLLGDARMNWVEITRVHN